MAAQVEVDRETGMVRIPRLVVVSDAGTALNILQVEAQDEGLAIIRLGHTLMEQLLLDEHGRIRNPGALDYRIPRIQDIPEACSVLIENGDGPGPYGSKGRRRGRRAFHLDRRAPGNRRDHSRIAADAGKDLGIDSESVFQYRKGDR